MDHRQCCLCQRRHEVQHLVACVRDIEKGGTVSAVMAVHDHYAVCMERLGILSSYSGMKCMQYTG
jgi:hypothetical protein